MLKFKYQNPKQFLELVLELSFKTDFHLTKQDYLKIERFEKLISGNDLNMKTWFSLTAEPVLTLNYFYEDDEEIYFNQLEFAHNYLQILEDEKGFEFEAELETIQPVLKMFFEINLDNKWNEEYLGTSLYDGDPSTHSLKAFMDSERYLFSMADDLFFEYMTWLMNKLDKQPNLFSFQKWTNKSPIVYGLGVEEETVFKKEEECDLVNKLLEIKENNTVEDFLLEKTPWDWNKVTTLDQAISQYLNYVEPLLAERFRYSWHLFKNTKEEYPLDEEVSLDTSRHTSEQFKVSLTCFTPEGYLESQTFSTSLEENPIEFFKKISLLILYNCNFLAKNFHVFNYTSQDLSTLNDFLPRRFEATGTEGLTQAEKEDVMQSLREEPVDRFKHAELGQIGYLDEESEQVVVFADKLHQYYSKRLNKFKDLKFSLTADFWDKW